MVPEYDDKTFEEQDLQCTKCNWKGKGYDANVIDFFGVSKSKEVHCPNCDTTIGTVVRNDRGNRGESANDLSFQFG